MPVIECDDCGARYDASEEALEVSDGARPVLCRDCGAEARLSPAPAEPNEDEPERPTDIDALSTEATLPPPRLPAGTMTLPPDAPTLPPEALEDRDTLVDEEPSAFPERLDTLPDRDPPSGVSDDALTASIPSAEPAPTGTADPEEQRDTLAEPPPDSALPLESRDFIRTAPRADPPPAPARPPAPAIVASQEEPRSPNIAIEPLAESSAPLRRSPMSDAPVVGDIDDLGAAPQRRQRSRAFPVFLTLAAVAAAFLAGMKLGDRDSEATSPVTASTAPPVEAAPTRALPPSETKPQPAPAEQPIARPAEQARAQRSSLLAASVPGAQRGGGAPRPKEPTPIENEPPAAPATPGSFDATAAETALAQAAFLARNCKRPEDRSGMAVVTVTFSPSGRVTSANVSGRPFAGTDTGSCIASSLRTARVPAFTGDFMTVKKTVLIQ